MFASATSLRRAMSCQFQFYAVDILKYREPSNSNLMFGIVMDETLNYNYGEKITSGKDLPKSHLQDFFRTHFDAQKEKVELWEDEDPVKLKEAGTEGVGLFHQDVIGTVMPARIQPKLSMTFANTNLILSGRPDVDEATGGIIDNKTAKASKPDTFINQSPQPPIYSILLDFEKSQKQAQTTELIVHQKIQEVRFDILVKTKKPKIQQLKVAITPEDRKAALGVIANTVKMIKSLKDSDNFPPTAFFRGGWECGYCPVAKLCRETWGLNIPESKLSKSAPPLSKKDGDEALGQFQEKIKKGDVKGALKGLEKDITKKGVIDPEEEMRRSILV